MTTDTPCASVVPPYRPKRPDRQTVAAGISKRIKLLRQKHYGMRAANKFALALGVPTSTYAYYEYGRMPRADVLIRICDVCGVSLDWLMRGGER